MKHAENVFCGFFYLSKKNKQTKTSTNISNACVGGKMWKQKQKQKCCETRIAKEFSSLKKEKIFSILFHCEVKDTSFSQNCFRFDHSKLALSMHFVQQLYQTITITKLTNVRLGFFHIWLFVFFKIWPWQTKYFSKVGDNITNNQPEIQKVRLSLNNCIIKVVSR